MKKLFFSLTCVSVAVFLLTVFSLTSSAQNWGGESGNAGAPGMSYQAQIRCTTTTTVYSVTCACFTDPYSGKPEFLHTCKEYTNVTYATATLCHRGPYNTYCTENIPC